MQVNNVSDECPIDQVINLIQKVAFTCAVSKTKIYRIIDRLGQSITPTTCLLSSIGK